MEVSCAFPTALDSPDNIAVAEQLGYARAWVYDTPQQSPDVWMTLALAAERTERIGLGPGVLVPSLRHPMANAAATATLTALAPGRVAVSFGTGFTGRRAMGYGAITWATGGNQRLAIMSTAVLFVVGLVLLVKIDVARGREAA